MPRSFSVQKLRDRAKVLANLQSPASLSFVPDTEWNEWISSAYTELYDLLCDSGLAYFRSTQTITSVSGQGTYTLPDDFLAVVKVEYRIDSQTWEPLPCMDEREDHRVVNTDARAFYYRIENNNLLLLPAPTVANQTYRVRYVPVAQDLVSDSQTVDGIDGWERLIVVDAAIQGRSKGDEDASELMQERDRILKRIEEKSQNRLLSGSPGKVFDVYADDSDLDPASWWYR